MFEVGVLFLGLTSCQLLHNSLVSLQCLCELVFIIAWPLRLTFVDLHICSFHFQPPFPELCLLFLMSGARAVAQQQHCTCEHLQHVRFLTCFCVSVSCPSVGTLP
jgi:hypothetical protein